ncbi:MAG: hypothetical protein LAO55_21335 [Acidobacteriia bacterium]|nr:hypothetical protein [Terriglobia bacterium]
MRSKLYLALFGICCLPVFAQLDSSTLRAKLGQPLNQETFHVPAGFDLIVDYGIGTTLVCKLEVPALMPRDPAAKISNTTELKQRMYDFLADLVPASERGKGGGTMYFRSGLISMMTTEYENVTVSEVQNDTQPEKGTITIRFKNAGCQTP